MTQACSEVAWFGVCQREVNDVKGSPTQHITQCHSIAHIFIPPFLDLSSKANGHFQDLKIGSVCAILGEKELIRGGVGQEKDDASASIDIRVSTKDEVFPDEEASPLLWEFRGLSLLR